MTRIAWLCAAAAAVTSLSACSSGTTPPTPCQEYARARVERVLRCGLNPGLSSDLLPHLIQRLALSCTAYASLPGSGMTAAYLRDCARLDDASSCAERWIEACSTEPAGTLAAGAGCTSDVQCLSAQCNTDGPRCGTCAAMVPIGGTCAYDTICATGAACSVGEGATNPTCTAITVSAAGEPCGTPTLRCATDLSCDYESSTCEAFPLAALGQSCLSAPCGYGLWCSGGLCASLLPEGAACGAYDFSCEEDLLCWSGVCTRATRAKAGQSCDGNIVWCEVGACDTSGGGDHRDLPDRPPRRRALRRSVEHDL